MNTIILAEVLRAQADDIQSNPDMSRSDAAELVRVLARVAEGKTLADAFGAPGDWGYQTAIGYALSSPGHEGDVVAMVLRKEDGTLVRIGDLTALRAAD